ncbi:MAG: PEP-CTERM sorting domain-containing protein [Luteolibacter sp.]
MNKFYTILSSSLLLTGMTQAALVSEIDNLNGVVDWSNEVFTGSITTNLDNLGRNDNFTNADFTAVTGINIGDGTAVGNQPFLDAAISGANFSGVTFNWNPYVTGAGVMRINMFRDQTPTGLTYANASFANTVWNITLTGSSIGTGGQAQYFNDGSGATTAANAADAVDFSGADFNFSGAGAATLSDDVGALLINNLGVFDGVTAIGAKYDGAFTANNFAAFGYATEGDLEAALVTAGWQAIPEPSSLSLLALGVGGLALRRRRNG